MRNALLRLATPLWRVVVIGIVLGGVCGGLLLHVQNVSEVTALIRINPPIDPSYVMTATAPSAEERQSYVSGEIAYLASPGFHDALAKSLNMTVAPEITATQDAQSMVVTLSTSQPDINEAKQIIDAAISVYSGHTQQQMRDRGSAAIAALDGVIKELTEASTPADQASTPEPTTEGATGWLNGPPAEETPPDVGNLPVPGDVPAQIQQLALQRQAIEVQSGRAPDIQIIQPATASKTTGSTPTWALGALAGALVGGILALSATYAWRRRAGIIVSPVTLEGQIENVLPPIVRIGALAETTDEYATLARSLYAQLPGPRIGRILLVGTSGDSGTTDVAHLISVAAAEQGVVCDIVLAEDAPTISDFESLTTLTSAPTAVIDGGAFGTSAALPVAAETAAQIVVVAMIGRDRLEAVRMAAQLARHTDVPICAVCTRPRTARARNRPSSRHITMRPTATTPVSVGRHARKAETPAPVATVVAAEPISAPSAPAPADSGPIPTASAPWPEFKDTTGPWPDMTDKNGEAPELEPELEPVPENTTVTDAQPEQDSDPDPDTMAIAIDADRANAQLQ